MKIINSVGACPPSFEYAYLDGKYCCRTNKEKIGRKPSDQCDGSQITLDSRCCENDDYSKCLVDKCVNYADAVEEHTGYLDHTYSWL